MSYDDFSFNRWLFFRQPNYSISTTEILLAGFACEYELRKGKHLELRICSKNQNSIFFKAFNERYISKSFLKVGIRVYLTGIQVWAPRLALIQSSSAGVVLHSSTVIDVFN